MEREVSPTPPTVLEEKVVVAQVVASAQTVQKQLAQLVRYTFGSGTVQDSTTS